MSSLWGSVPAARRGACLDGLVIRHSRPSSLGKTDLAKTVQRKRFH
jgi:hypothetical protein